MQLFIKDAGQAQPPHDFQQRRKTIDPFGSNVHLKGHPLSLSNSRYSQIFQRMNSDEFIKKLLSISISSFYFNNVFSQLAFPIVVASIIPAMIPDGPRNMPNVASVLIRLGKNRLVNIFKSGAPVLSFGCGCRHCIYYFFILKSSSSSSSAPLSTHIWITCERTVFSWWDSIS
jgi:hypothetical protein